MKVKIFKKQPSPTQSGNKNMPWIIKPISEDKYRKIDDVMGWTSSSESKMQLNLEFDNLELAEEYAKNNGWSYIISAQTSSKKIVKKSYADNFQ